MYIPRAIEETVRSVSKTFPVLLLTGPRQVGKTTVLQKMADDERGYVTLDDPDARYLAKSDPSLFFTTLCASNHHRRDTVCTGAFAIY